MWRYYNVGLLNTAFGYGLYALLVFLGLNLFVAQIIGQICGATFNYFTYGRLVFRGVGSNLYSYVGAYGLNYLLALAFLTLAHRFIASPYLAGFVALVAVSVINYLVLKRFVFRAAKPSP